MRKPGLTFPLIIAAFVLSGSAAMAVQLQAVRDTAIRDSAGTQVGTMPSGAVYEGSCEQTQCYVDAPSGADGWVLGTDLIFANASGGLGFNFNFGGGSNNQPPPRVEEPRDDDGEVCFFDRPNFRGSSFCVAEGESADRLPRSWNDRISSISVDRDLYVEVCRDTYLEGSCTEYDRDVERLPSRLNDRISSFEVGG